MPSKQQDVSLRIKKDVCTRYRSAVQGQDMDENTQLSKRSKYAPQGRLRCHSREAERPNRTTAMHESSLTLSAQPWGQRPAGDGNGEIRALGDT